MKKIYFLLLLVSTLSNAQVSGSFVIDWKENASFNIGNAKYIVPQFNYENYLFDNVKKSIEFRLNIPTSTDMNENSLRITNIVYENVIQLGDLSLQNIPASISATVKSVNARDNKFAQISLSPIIKTKSGFQRVKSFNYQIEKGVLNSISTYRGFTELSNSVLANGEWFRFYVEKSGVYKISKTFLQQLGIKVNSINPRNIKIYGNGGRMIPLSNAINYPSDLEENAIQVIGEEDGSFDTSDYILFYAEGFDNWSQENKTHLNLYDTKSYYYITVQGGSGKRMTEMPEITSDAVVITTYDSYSFYEKDLINIVRLGRRWFGDDFSFDNDQTFNFSLPNISSNSEVQMQVTAAANSLSASVMNVKVNGTDSGNISFSSTGTDLAFSENTLSFTVSASIDMAVQLTYNNNGVPSAKGYLDYIIVKAKCDLSGFGKQYRFQYNAASSMMGFGEFQFSNAKAISQVWDITDIYNISKKVNDNQNSFSFKAALGEVRKYIAVDKQDYFTPKKESNTKVVNQNLKGTIFKNAQGSFQDIDYLIITPAFLNSSAEKLANFHRKNSGMNVKVVNLENIYAEFCSGKQDIGAIRNFVKYVYNNASNSANKVKYLNLFGAASFDFKNRIPNNTNVVPIYQALESSIESASSFCSDDFFGLMDLNEGVSSNGSGLDIAVGRMIVADVQDADEMVNKVIEYHDLKSYGSWRNNLVFISDDPSSEKPGDKELQYYQNKLGDDIGAQKPFLNVNKILLDSYVQEASGGGDRYPEARKDIFEAFEKGALVFNYLGHGGEDGLADERIWEKEDGQNVNNRYKYPLFITITCDFSRFDNPYKQTGGEITYLNPTGGAISMITTVRAIGQETAQVFNPVLAKYLFAYDGSPYVSIAEALRKAKNDSNSSTNVVVYIGDPALFLAIPKPKVILTQVNDLPISGTFDDFKSLGVMKVAGQVVDENNAILENYDGTLAVTIFDKNINVTTLRNDLTDALIDDNPDTTAPTMSFVTLGETIFRGNANVANGNFEFNFVVPRDIRVPLGNGRISFYAKQNNELLDQTGVNTDIKVGGINENAAADTTPPTVKLFMNDESFISGGITNESPILLALLEDENGMNTASGIGHDMVAILDGDESNPYLVTDYYETDLDNYKKGRLKFPFRNLEKGLHTLTFKAWDVYNNPISAEIQFVVVGDESLTLKNVLNYPNPFVSYTQFWFTHNRPFEPLEVQVQVMTVTGKVVWTKNQIVNTDGFLSREITWDGKDDFGDKIGKGVYIYKLTVKSTLTNKKTEKFEKLVIL
jgi:hypothetical protein